MIRAPKLKIDGPGIGSSTGCSIVMSLNSFPVMSANISPATDFNVSSVSAKDIASMFAGLAEAIKKPAGTEINLEMSDGNNGHLSFNGKVIGVSYGGGVGALAANISVVHSSAKLSGFAPYLYAIIPSKAVGAAGFTMEDAYIGRLINIEGGLGSRIIQMINQMSKRAEYSGLDIVSAAQIMQRLAINHQLQPDVLRLFTTIENMEVPGGKDEVLSQDLNKRIFEILSDRSSSFLQLLSSLGSEFHFEYAPGIGKDDVGRLVPYKELYTGGGIPVSVPVSAVARSRDLGAALLPVTGLVLRGQSKVYRYQYIDEDAIDESLIIGTYPSIPDFTGVVVDMPAPVWAKQRSTSPKITIDIKDPYQDPTGQLLENYQKQIADSIAASKTSLGKCLQEMAEVRFAKLSSSATSQMLTIPLDLSGKWQLGNRYEISSSGSGKLFTGALIKVEHKLDINSRSAETSLTFTAVE